MLQQAADSAAQKKPATKKPAAKPQNTAIEKKETESSSNKDNDPVPPRNPAKATAEPVAKNHERFTVSIYQNDIQAASVIREQLDAHGGINFPTRSMIVRIALRIASQASPKQLLTVYQKVSEDDQRLGKNKKK